MMNHVTGKDFEYWFQFHEVQKHRNHRSENIVAFSNFKLWTTLDVLKLNKIG